MSLRKHYLEKHLLLRVALSPSIACVNMSRHVLRCVLRLCTLTVFSATDDCGFGQITKPGIMKFLSSYVRYEILVKIFYVSPRFY